MSPTDALFTSFKAGTVGLRHRIVMAPLTRMRSEPGTFKPTDTMATYYEQRTSAGGLILTEATQISKEGMGYPMTPGIYSDEQVEGWKKVVQGVHKKKGWIFCQLWHVGRVSHPSHQPDGKLPVAPSALRCEAPCFTASFEQAEHPVPRALELDEIQGVIDQYVAAARNAKRAGFDGVELHSANGYLLDQFINDNSNKRTDKYGGSLENRCRLTLEVLDALIGVFGKGRVGVRFSPSSKFNTMDDSNPTATFSYIVTEADKKGLAYIHLVDPRTSGDGSAAGTPDSKLTVDFFRKITPNKTPLIVAGGLTVDTATKYVEAGDADLVCFGRQFISNPDLPFRIKNGLELNKYDRSTFYGGTEKGYTDYPFYNGDETNNEKVTAKPWWECSIQ